MEEHPESMYEKKKNEACDYGNIEFVFTSEG